MERKDFKIVSVEWIDSHVCSNWRCLSNWDKPIGVICNTVGFLIQDGAEGIRIAAHIGIDSEGDLQICGDIVIPVVCIKSIKEIKAVKEEASDETF